MQGNMLCNKETRHEAMGDDGVRIMDGGQS